MHLFSMKAFSQEYARRDSSFLRQCSLLQSSERTWISHCSKSRDFIARCKNPAEKVWETVGWQSCSDFFWHCGLGFVTWQKSFTVSPSWLHATCPLSLGWLAMSIREFTQYTIFFPLGATSRFSNMVLKIWASTQKNMLTESNASLPAASLGTWVLSWAHPLFHLNLGWNLSSLQWGRKLHYVSADSWLAFFCRTCNHLGRTVAQNGSGKDPASRPGQMYHAADHGSVWMGICCGKTSTFQTCILFPQLRLE